MHPSQVLWRLCCSLNKSLRMQHCIFLNQSHPYVKTYFIVWFYTQQKTQLTAQHSDLVSMLTKKIKHDIYGHKILVQRFCSGQHTSASSQDNHHTASMAEVCCWGSKYAPHPHQSQNTSRTAKGKAEGPAGKAVLCLVWRWLVIIGIAAGHAATSPNSCVLHTSFHPFQVIFRWGKGYRQRCYLRHCTSTTKRWFKDKLARIIGWSRSKMLHSIRNNMLM